MERINNLVYRLKAVVRRFFRAKNKIALPPSNYELVKEYDLTQYNEKDWTYGPKWGEFHPKQLYVRYDMEGNTIQFNDNNVLKMAPRFEPKTYKKSDFPHWQQDMDVPDEFVIVHKTPRLHSVQAYRYGWFEAKIKLPKGKNLWPAYWLTGANSWPPEIDMLEAYSKYDKNYGNKWGISSWKLQPNIHYGIVEQGSKGSTGAVDIPIYKATEKFIHYACLWEEDRIEIYYDGRIAYECKDPEVLKWFNMGHNWMVIILSMGLCNEGKDIEYATMEFKDVKVYQKKKNGNN